MLSVDDRPPSVALDPTTPTGPENRDSIENSENIDEPSELAEESLSTRVLSIVKHLPVIRGIYFQVAKEVNDPRASLDKVAALVASDAVLTGRILQLANSSVFACKQRLVNAKEAVFFLGGDQVKDMILAVEVFSFFSRLRVKGFSPERQWRHSQLVANTAKAILRNSGASRTDQDSAYTAGLLHDIGKLLLASNLPSRYESALSNANSEIPESLLSAEAQEFKVSHPEVGGIVLGSWNLPPQIVNAVLLHHDPVVLQDKKLSVESAVAIANSLVKDRGESSSDLNETAPMAAGIKKHFGEDQIAFWKSKILSKN